MYLDLTFQFGIKLYFLIQNLKKPSSGCQQVPVYSGASQSLVHPWKQSEKPYHGQDGFGDADLPPQPPAATLLQPRHAVWALLDLVKQHSGEAEC